MRKKGELFLNSSRERGERERGGGWEGKEAQRETGSAL